MKNYQKFINESHEQFKGINNDLRNIYFHNFKFAIDMRNKGIRETEEVFNEIRKYFDISDKDEYYLTNRLAWCWAFEISNSFNKASLYISEITVLGWGAGWKYMDDIITPKEFLNVGFKGVKEYIETKSDMKKYNL